MRNYFQVYIEEFKSKIKKKQMVNFIDHDYDLIDSSDSDDFNDSE